ncbi:small secreted protein [Streptomyces sp. NPDC021093]|uniref:small secreted protein n=1 Tax=Streptomyces sp. NPDC021093 TaxID=3365112 RepID=UPI00378D8AEE
MNKKLAAALSGGAVLVMMATLSGCGDDAEDKKAEWSKAFCPKEKTALDKRSKAEQLIVATAADGKPEDIKKADVAAFQQVAESNRALAEALRTSGVPPIDKGEQLQKDGIKQLEAQAAAYTALKKKAEALDPKNGDAFAKGLKEIGADMEKADKLLSKAQPTCQKPKDGAGSPAAGQ